jgi:hypothetical protein
MKERESYKSTMLKHDNPPVCSGFEENQFIKAATQAKVRYGKL